MATVQTPGIYIEEIPTLPASMAELPTALPAFIGHTEKAWRSQADDLRLIPTRISSLLEYEQLFGGPSCPPIQLTLSEAPDGFSASIQLAAPKHLLHHALQLFFANGGESCYICSAGGYRAAPTLASLRRGLTAVGATAAPTLLVCPEAVRLTAPAYATLVQAMLKQASDRQDRFALLDMLDGSSTRPDLDANRSHFGASGLSWGAAYFPFLRSSISPAVRADESNVSVKLPGQRRAVPLASLAPSQPKAYAAAKAAIAAESLSLPPSGAVAGVYAQTDAVRGVWKAPANVSLAGVKAPVVALSNAEQEDFNAAADGRSINVIRSFTGKGTLVWGARTLAGNDPLWRYVPVRRLAILLEQSIRQGMASAVFEPNDAANWARLRSRVETFLNKLWRQGAMMGAKPALAFYVHCGLGSTMTSQDLLERRLILELGFAPMRPAEFIVLRIQLAMPE